MTKVTRWAGKIDRIKSENVFSMHVQNDGPFVKYEDYVDIINGTEQRLREWADARTAFFALDTKDVRNSDETRTAMNRLASAENALYQAVRS